MKIHAVAASFATFCLALSLTAAPQNKGNYLAQKLVDDTHTKHPEAVEIGIATVGSGGCKTIASTDKKDIGEKCEKEDSEPIRTGKPYVETEGKNFDVTLPLHDSSGKIVGSVGLELTPKPGESQDAVVEQAQSIAKEMEAAIPTKASLTQSF
jgi:hypothetical protein